VTDRVSATTLTAILGGTGPRQLWLTFSAAVPSAPNSCYPPWSPLRAPHLPARTRFKAPVSHLVVDVVRQDLSESAWVREALLDRLYPQIYADLRPDYRYYSLRVLSAAAAVRWCDFVYLR